MVSDSIPMLFFFKNWVHVVQKQKLFRFGLLPIVLHNFVLAVFRSVCNSFLETAGFCLFHLSLKAFSEILYKNSVQVWLVYHSTISLLYHSLLYYGSEAFSILTFGAFIFPVTAAWCIKSSQPWATTSKSHLMEFFVVLTIALFIFI